MKSRRNARLARTAILQDDTCTRRVSPDLVEVSPVTVDDRLVYVCASSAGVSGRIVTVRARTVTVLAAIVTVQAEGVQIFASKETRSSRAVHL